MAMQRWNNTTFGNIFASINEVSHHLSLCQQGEQTAEALGLEGSLLLELDELWKREEM